MLHLVPDFRDELLIAALEFLLRIPMQLIGPVSIIDEHSAEAISEQTRNTSLLPRLTPIMCLAFELGVSYIPLVSRALDTLESWSTYFLFAHMPSDSSDDPDVEISGELQRPALVYNQDSMKEEFENCLRQTLPLLESYLRISPEMDSGIFNALNSRISKNLIFKI